MTLALLGAAYGLALAGPELWARWTLDRPAGGETFRVMTANVWHDKESWLEGEERSPLPSPWAA
jgi:hypothetical protein